MGYLFIALLVLLGVSLVAIEILFPTKVSIAAIAAAALFMWAIVLSYSAMGGVFALFVFFSSFTLTVVAMAFALRAKTLRQIAIDRKRSLSGDGDILSVAIGDKGVAATNLSPLGRIEIGGLSYTARSRGEQISHQSRVVVVALEDSVVVVDIDR